MKSFQQFLSESITINGDFNGTLNVGASQPEQQQEESFSADIVWEGKIYRLEVDGPMMSKSELAEHILSQYPGAIIQNIYPGSYSPSKIKSAQRYRPERLSWSD
jgi:hypothetical protein